MLDKMAEKTGRWAERVGVEPEKKGRDWDAWGEKWGDIHINFCFASTVPAMLIGTPCLLLGIKSLNIPLLIVAGITLAPLALAGVTTIIIMMVMILLCTLGDTWKSLTGAS